MTKIIFLRQVACLLVVIMFLLGIAPRIEAGFSPSEVINITNTDRDDDINRIQKFIETKMIKERLNKLGFTYEEIQTRILQLSDEQIHELALQLDELKVGGDGLEIIIALLIIAILVVILIKLTGHKIIVTK